MHLDVPTLLNISYYKPYDKKMSFLGLTCISSYKILLCICRHNYDVIKIRIYLMTYIEIK